MPGDNIYPDLSNDKFDIQYARLLGLSSDMQSSFGVVEEATGSAAPGNPPIFETPDDDSPGAIRFGVEDNTAGENRSFDLAGAYSFAITQLGNNQFLVDPTNGLYQLGAVPVPGSDSGLSYTYLEIDDSTRKITLQASEGIVLPGYGSGVHVDVPAYSLGVDAGGNLIEFVAAGTSQEWQLNGTPIVTNPVNVNFVDDTVFDMIEFGGDALILIKFQWSITSDVNGLKLTGDVLNPGTDMYYGTDGTGVRGWYAITGGSDTNFANTNLTADNNRVHTWNDFNYQQVFADGIWEITASDGITGDNASIGLSNVNFSISAANGAATENAGIVVFADFISFVQNNGRYNFQAVQEDAGATKVLTWDSGTTQMSWIAIGDISGGATMRFGFPTEDATATENRAFDLAGAFSFAINQLGNNQFLVDPANGLYQLGAVPIPGSDSGLSYTYLEIDDSTRKITLQAAEGIVLPGYGVGVHEEVPDYGLGVDASGNVIEYLIDSDSGGGVTVVHASNPNVFNVAATETTLFDFSITESSTPPVGTQWHVKIVTNNPTVSESRTYRLYLNEILRSTITHTVQDPLDHTTYIVVLDASTVHAYYFGHRLDALQGTSNNNVSSVNWATGLRIRLTCQETTGNVVKVNQALIVKYAAT